MAEAEADVEVIGTNPTQTQFDQVGVVACVVRHGVLQNQHHYPRVQPSGPPHRNWFVANRSIHRWTDRWPSVVAVGIGGVVSLAVRTVAGHG